MRKGGREGEGGREGGRERERKIKSDKENGHDYKNSIILPYSGQVHAPHW